MKVLYIGHYREFGGWGQAAKDHILALDKVGVDVVCRNVTLTGDREITGRLLELEQKDTSGCDVCIQHVLPHHLVGTRQFRKNIAFVETETVSIKHLPWFDLLKQADEVWTPNRQAKEFLDADGLNVPTAVVPHPCDIKKYAGSYKDVNIPPAEGKFRFYYIGDMNDRKNIDAIITCFHSEFDAGENAALILKINKFGKSQQEIKDVFDKRLFDVKQSLRMHPNPTDYARDITIIGELPDDQLYGLHKYCHCFLSPSHGEAWSLPAFDAMVFGNTPICSDFGGPREFIDRNNAQTGTLVGGCYKTCKCSDSAFPDMFTGREFWFDADEMQMRAAMRRYFEAAKDDPAAAKRANQAYCIGLAQQFDYDAVGTLMKDKLNE